MAENTTKYTIELQGGEETAAKIDGITLAIQHMTVAVIDLGEALGALQNAADGLDLELPELDLDGIDAMISEKTGKSRQDG